MTLTDRQRAALVWEATPDTAPGFPRLRVPRGFLVWLFVFVLAPAIVAALTLVRVTYAALTDKVTKVR